MDAENTVICWGSGEHGQNGHGMMKTSVSLGSDIRIRNIPAYSSYRLACGSSHTVCLSKGEHLRYKKLFRLILALTLSTGYPVMSCSGLVSFHPHKVKDKLNAKQLSLIDHCICALVHFIYTAFIS